MPANPYDKAQVQAALVGRYRIGDEIRTGGQGAVFRATRLRSGNGQTCNDDVALKLHFDSRQDERVEREITAVRDLVHPKLASLLEEGVIDVGGRQTRYIAWTFIDGEPLDLLLTKRPRTENEACCLGRDVSAAITALWSKRIVHRDIAPKNIMVKTDGNAVLIDLGGARHLDHTTITAPGATFGTVGYLSPEQCRAERALTSGSDVFALGVVLLEALLGRHPTNLDQYLLVAKSPEVDALIPVVGSEVRAVITRMVRLRASFRPQPYELTNIFISLLGMR